MAVTFDFEHDVNTVFQLLTDPDFVVERSQAMGDSEVECEVEDYDDRTEMHVRRVVVRDLPKMLAKVFSSTQELKVHEIWNKDGDNWTGNYTVTITGQPVTVTAQFSLVATDKGCRYHISHQGKAKIPLVGGAVEKYIESQTGEGSLQELEFAKARLHG